MHSLNDRAHQLVQTIVTDASSLGAIVGTAECGTQVIDCGSKQTPGSVELGLLLARICLADLAEVSLVPSQGILPTEHLVAVSTSEPLLACMASQYAGWKISHDNYFAMGSGPMRALHGGEAILSEITLHESRRVAVGVLEGKIPPSVVCENVARDCGVAPSSLTLLAARTASLAGTIQVVARSVETALHKMHTLGISLAMIRRGTGTAPLVPIASDDLGAIGWTNDAVLYGGDVTLEVEHASDGYLADVVTEIPSSVSKDFGRPFREIFSSYGYDFYKLDPLLFSPAKIKLVNLTTGKVHEAGRLRGDILAQALAGK